MKLRACKTKPKRSTFRDWSKGLNKWLKQFLSLWIRHQNWIVRLSHNRNKKVSQLVTFLKIETLQLSVSVFTFFRYHSQKIDFPRISVISAHFLLDHIVPPSNQTVIPSSTGLICHGAWTRPLNSCEWRCGHCFLDFQRSLNTNFEASNTSQSQYRKAL